MKCQKWNVLIGFVLVKFKKMSKSIWKFELEVKDYQIVEMPKDSKILYVQSQFDIPCVWAECDTETEEKDHVEFEIYGTGHPFYENSHFGKDQEYIGTFQLGSGTFVGHLYLLKEIKNKGL